MKKKSGETVLSIIVPVYNTELSFLEVFSDSFCNNYDSRIELIFVDDGSDDKTKENLGFVSSKIINKCSIYFQKNGGQNSARMNGASHADGTYLLFADSDDFIDWASLCKLLDFLECSNADLVPFNCHVVDDNRRSMNDLFLADKKEKNNEEYKRYCLTHCSSLWQQCIRRVFYERTGLGLFSGSKIGEDLASIFPMYVLALSIQPINIFLYSYVQRDSSIMHSAAANQHLGMLDVFNYIISVLGDNLEEYKTEFEWLAIWHLLYLEPRFLITESSNGIGVCRVMRKWLKNNFKDWKDNIYYNKEKRIGVLLLIRRHYYFYALFHWIKNFVSLILRTFEFIKRTRKCIL